MAKFTSGDNWRDYLTSGVKTEEQISTMAQKRANDEGTTFYIWDANTNKAESGAKWRLSHNEPTYLKRQGITYTTIEPEEL